MDYTAKQKEMSFNVNNKIVFRAWGPDSRRCWVEEKLSVKYLLTLAKLLEGLWKLTEMPEGFRIQSSNSLQWCHAR